MGVLIPLWLVQPKALIDLDALRYNLKVAIDLSQYSKIMAVIKADAYGHGAIGVSKALSDNVDAFGVASIEEAIELREAGIKTPVHLLEGTFSDDEITIASKNNFSISCVNQKQKNAIIEARNFCSLKCMDFCRYWNA